jgi:hypothetical protein
MRLLKDFSNCSIYNLTIKTGLSGCGMIGVLGTRFAFGKGGWTRHPGVGTWWGGGLACENLVEGLGVYWVREGWKEQ